MSRAINQLVLRVLERAPQWVRQDLLSADPIVRARAEETLAAMISNSLAESKTKSREAKQPDGSRADG